MVLFNADGLDAAPAASRARAEHTQLRLAELLKSYLLSRHAVPAARRRFAQSVRLVSLLKELAAAAAATPGHGGQEAAAGVQMSRFPIPMELKKVETQLRKCFLMN